MAREARGRRWRRPRIRFVPTRRLAWAVLLLAPVWLLSGTAAGLAVAAGASLVLLALVLADGAATTGPARLRVERRAPESVGLGDSSAIEYGLESAWPRALTVEVHDPLVPGLARLEPAPAAQPWQIARVTVPARRAATIRAAVSGRIRGEFEFEPIVVRVYGPAGLVQRTNVYPASGVMRVVPSTAGVRRYRLLAVQHRLREAGIRTIRRRGEGTSFANLREYGLGDDPRHIDWKATGRRGRLITREYSVEQGQTVLLAIDAGRLMTQRAGELSRFEHALAAATVLADIAIRSGDNVGVIIFNDEVRAFVPPGRGSVALGRIREAMVPIRANMAEPDYASAFRLLAARHRKRSLLVLFTDVIDPRASRALIAHTARSAARHLPLVVALQNDELVRAARPRADGEAPVYESAAAEELLLEREEALARMRRAGVSVLDVSPHVMTAAVVNRYLSIKARSSL